MRIECDEALRGPAGPPSTDGAVTAKAAPAPGPSPGDPAVAAGRLGVEDEIGFVLRLAQLALFKDLADALAPLSLRPSDFSALRVIARNPGLKQQSVGEKLGLRRPNLVPAMDELARRGLIDRRTPDEDRRSYALHLTEAGKALLAQAEAAHRGHQARLGKALGAADPALILDGLRKLAALGKARDRR